MEACWDESGVFTFSGPSIEIHSPCNNLIWFILTNFYGESLLLILCWRYTPFNMDIFSIAGTAQIINRFD